MRLGRLRGVFRYYGDEVMPFYARNAWVAVLPCGVGLLCWGAGSLVYADGSMLGIRLFVLGFALLVGAVVLTYRPPEWAKPSWLRKLDREPVPVQESLRRMGIC